MPNLQTSMENNERENIESGTTEQKGPDLNSWLPVTASREAKWWYSTFHNVTAMVGAGVLGLPYAMSQLGWIPGVLGIFLSWMITFYTLWQLVELHEVEPGRRFDRYPELGQYALGEKLGYWIIMPQQLLVQVASDIVYVVTGGKSLKKFAQLLIPGLSHIRQTYFILFFVALQFLLSQTPNFNSLKAVSFVAALMSFCYSMVAFVSSISKGLHHHPTSYGVRSHTTPGIIFNALSGIGTIAFSYAGHSVVLEIQATIPSSPQNPSKKPMWKGVVLAYIIVIICYMSVAVSGFWAFGDLVEDDVLISLEKPRWTIAIANLMVFFHVIGSFQVYAMPVFDKIESYLVTKRNFTPGKNLRLVARSGYVAFVGIVGICVPFFGGLLGFFGGLVFASTSYFIPCIIWLVVQKPKRWSFHWFASWISIFVGVSIALLSPIGGARQIFISAKTYKAFS
uniref:Amino acid transporter transmembrane domain-containing protein n=2 Tax=Manihot esculenta TaxID=3983 RepID=A0A2C9U3S0_MANES